MIKLCERCGKEFQVPACESKVLQQGVRDSND